MPEGPLGFPRLTDVGPFVKSDKSAEDTFIDLTTRSHSYRGYEPQEFFFLIEEGYSNSELRKELKAIEDGRFYQMLKESHEFWWPLDQDEKETFASRNPELIQWIEIYGILEDQARPSGSVEVH